MQEEAPMKLTETTKKHEALPSLRALPKEFRQRTLTAGVDAEEKGRSGSFLQMDSSVVFSKSKVEGVEVLPTTEALKKYDWLRDYYWKVVSPEKDEYTKAVYERLMNGYFIRALPGVKVKLPVQACLLMADEASIQNVHNIIIAEEGSSLQIITGCTTAPSVESGLHIGISEFFVKDNASIYFTMVHNWKREFMVRPRSAARIGNNASFTSNYVCMNPVRDVQMYPAALCEGTNSSARFSSILYAQGNTAIDVGSRAVLSGQGSSVEMVSRGVANDRANIIMRGEITGEARGTKGHLECNGLMLSQTARMQAIPMLDAKTDDSSLSHEAAVGKLDRDKIEYIMSRGLSESEAVSLMVRGFLDVEILGLPPS